MPVPCESVLVRALKSSMQQKRNEKKSAVWNVMFADYAKILDFPVDDKREISLQL